MMVVFNIGGASSPVDQSSWADVWQAAAAINEMCVKHLKTGSSVVSSKWGVSYIKKNFEEISASRSFDFLSAGSHFQEVYRVRSGLTDLLQR